MRIFRSAVDMVHTASHGRRAALLMRHGVNPRRLAAIPLTIAVFALALAEGASAAAAATVSVSGGILTYTAVSGEQNNVTIVPAGGGSYQVTDSGTMTAFPNGPVTVTAGTGCVSNSSIQATCSGVINSLSVTADDGSDTVDTSQVSLPASVTGGTGSDRLSTGAGNDTLNGGSEDDWIDGGAGSDTLIGGTGNNVAVYASHSAPVTVTLDGVQNDGAAGENDSVATDFQHVEGGSGNDTLIGNGNPNFLAGGLGNDTITGNGGGDYISYLDRTDPITIDFSSGTFGDVALGEHDTVTDSIENAAGGAGNDHLTGDGAANVLWGGWGGNDWYQGRGGADTFWGSQGVDTVDYSDRSSASPVTVTIDGVANDGVAGEGDNVSLYIDNVTGGSGADTITGSAGANTLDGGPGSDQLTGGLGDDTFLARDGAVDSLSCGDGSDGGSADPSDTVASDCEAVDQSPPPADPPPADPPATDTTTPTDPPPDTTPPPGDGNAKAELPPLNSLPPAIPHQTVTVSASGVAKVLVVCPPNSGGCRGVVTLELPAAPARAGAGRGKIVVGARRRARVKVGRRSFKAKAGTSPKIPVRLSKRGRQRILRGGRTGCRLKVVTRAADGTPVVTTQNIALRPRRRGGYR
jgi:Ca2+-binding RTX toxin-like protein